MREGITEHRAKWRGLVLEQFSSGQTVAAFCRERGIRAAQFYDWKKRIREGEASKFVEVRVKESSEQGKPAPGHYPAIEVRLNSGRSLVVEPGFDSSHLRSLLAVLETE